MIRMLHFADVHVGMENYGHTQPETGLSSRVMDFLRRMDEMIGYAREQGADLIIFAGDAFKNRQPNPTFQREFASRVNDMAKLCPVVLLVGNHDLPTTAARASSIEIFGVLDVPNVLVGDEYRLYTISTRSGPVQVATAPYPMRSGLLTDKETHSLTINEIDDRMRDALQLVLRDLARQAAQSNAPRVLTGHFTVTGALPGSERNVMVGHDVSVLLSEVADPTWDYVAMGHIHKYQNLTDGRDDVPPVVYSGSLERIDFGEEGDEKGFCWVELERGETRWQFVPVHARPFVTLRIDVRGSDNPMQKVFAAIHRYALDEAVVRVIIQADLETEAQLQDKAIYDVLRDAKVSMIAAVQKEVERPVRSRLGISPEGLSSLELLERYFQSKEMSPERIAQLLERAETFLASES